jgi:hypothetical protein
MPVNTSTARYGFDAGLAFRDRGLAAVTATTSSNTILLDRLTSYFNSGDQAQNLNAFAVVEVETLTVSGATFSVALQAGVGAGFTNSFDLLSLPVAATGIFILPLVRERLALANASADRVRVTFTVTGGTSPNAQFNAFLTQVLGH